MKAGLLLGGNGAIIYLTSHSEVLDRELITKFEDRGIKKFIAFELPIDEVAKKYGGHYTKVLGDLHEKDDLRILDIEGNRAFSQFSFQEMGTPIYHE